MAASYEPGSTFKAFTVAGALEEKLIEPETEFSLPPTIQVADREIGEAHDRGGLHAAGVGDPRPVLERRLGDDRPQARAPSASTAGSAASASAAAPASTCRASSRASCLRPKDYSGSSMGNMPIGQGLAVTPIQMAAAYTAIANHGVMRPPHVIAGDAAQAARACSRARTADSVSRMLEGVLGPGGTAQEASVEGYKLAGKTGTAEKPDEFGGYSKTKFVASFIGYAPARDPRLLVAVMVDEPKGEIYGGVVAAPAFERIVEFALPYLRIPPRLKPRRRAINDRAALLASVAGMTLRELMGEAAPDAEITALAYSSRDVTPGALFFCVRGFTADGHDFAPDAVERGAAALVCERPLGLGVPEVLVDDARAAMGPAAARFFGDPTAELRVVGITGTNGKTTTAFLVAPPARGGRRADRPARHGQAGGGRRGGGGRAHHAGGDRPAGHLPPRCSTRATAPA